MNIINLIKKLDRETLINILLKIINEFPIIRQQLIDAFKEHFKES